ncbi:hypothetical protein [Acidocella aminolytica]|jgi:hypothetical protein|uniref:Uncharacterized protein n=1 Tax=Acidocella aminolytica 101 = DSM 11237 TaxID=1120923 RepID=A0A0D6PE36_9PROT|nr:hypothetical protein [Acidocella aminolytica]GAN79937.1 hypothetical protein Aam_034_081 [Acidocella aminolytica 101 = DSM 11237]GBQ36847.1 hypothetical protein AA11237_1359 [Acidocella aminolytica 101 = DSM 11237]SHE58952.1 hypothetical protein SAMN02746095_00846 [Acidocella aminolytica 101 = DSM 11237]
MPAIASFVRLPREELKDIAKAITGDDPQSLPDVLAANGTSVVEFEEDGDIFSVLLPVLADDYDIDLETSENAVLADLAEVTEALVFILTKEDQDKYYEQLNPENFTVEELDEAYEDFSEEDADGAGAAMLAGIGALYQALQEVDVDHVVVVTVT